MSTWAFEHLNEVTLSPLHESPSTSSSSSFTNWGPTGLELEASLEDWTNTAFFDSADFGGLSGYEELFLEKEEGVEKEGGERHVADGGAKGGAAGAKRCDESLKDLEDFLAGAEGYTAGSNSTSNYSLFPSYVDQVLQLDALAPSSSSFASTPSDTPEASIGARANKKRKTSIDSFSSTSSSSLYTSPAIAAESLDKRQRNTAASARFRSKKKEREAALESTVRELAARAEALTDDVDTLATENKWLRSLITGKYGKVPEPSA
ncbi:hypothetical protein RQP46_009035 [Phenoliferia psychrophenolica]